MIGWVELTIEQPERKVSDSGSEGGSSARTWRGEGLGRGTGEQKRPPLHSSELGSTSLQQVRRLK